MTPIRLPKIGKPFAGFEVDMSSESDTTRIQDCDGLPPESVIFGSTDVMLELRRKVQRVSTTNLPILLRGESGVGKNLLSRYIHNNSSGAAGAYMRLNCTIMSSSLLDSLLSNARDGDMDYQQERCVEDSGSSPVTTLFLDEVADLAPKLHGELLDLLSDQDEFGTSAHAGRGSSPRIVCATTRNLRQETSSGKFRQELLYRLMVVTFEIPPLRSRLYDLLTIADYLRQCYSHTLGVPARPFSSVLLERMHHYEWPGNIRELESFVCRYLILGSEEYPVVALRPSHSTAEFYNLLQPGDALLNEVSGRTLAAIERAMIIKALDHHHGNLRKAAAALGVSYRTLMNKIDRAGLPRVRHTQRSRSTETEPESGQ